jgi:lysophospholipase L1-like esterase
VNSQGFRGPEFTSSSSSRRQRILVLGDSVTFGYGVQEDSTFVERLDSLLVKELCPGGSWSVINGGIEDMGIREERMILEEKGDAIEPDIVLLGFFANDSRPPVGFQQEYLVEDPLDRWVRTHPSITFRSRLASFLHYHYRKLLMALHLYRSPIPARFAWVDLWREGGWRTDPSLLDSLVGIARFDWGAAWSEESWSIVSHELELVRGWCAARGVQLGVFYLPVHVQIEGSKQMPYPGRMLGGICENLQLPFHDTVPVLRGCTDCFIDQCHLTPEGHRRVAAGLQEWLCEEFKKPMGMG